MKGDGIIKLPGREYYYTDFYVSDTSGKSKQIRRSLKTADARVAKKRAEAIYQDFMNLRFGVVEAKKFRSEFATIGEVIERYEKHAAECVKPKTVQGNVCSLRSILRKARGVSEVDGLKASVLTGQLVADYEAARAGEITDAVSRLRVRTSIASNLRQARAMFDPAKRKWFSGLMLPDLAEFRSTEVHGPGSRKPQPLPVGAIEGIRAAATGLKVDQPAVYLAFLLFSRLGMRNVEICAARWHWIERRADGSAWMAIVCRPEEEFDPKGNEGRVRIEPDVLAELEGLRSPGDDFVIPARHATEREEIVYRLHSQWASQWIKDRSKTSYELRRYAGSLVYRNTRDLMQVKEFLRHADIQTTTKWYAYLLGEAPGVSMGDF